MKKISFNEFCLSENLNLSALRKDVLLILFNKKKPMGAYEILETLKKKRSTAEPPTVYRVLKWLMDVNLIHKIETQNKYVFCSSFKNESVHHKNILLICKKCDESVELSDNQVSDSLKKFALKQRIQIDDSIIEIKGICAECAE